MDGLWGTSYESEFLEKQKRLGEMLMGQFYNQNGSVYTSIELFKTWIKPHLDGDVLIAKFEEFHPSYRKLTNSEWERNIASNWAHDGEFGTVRRIVEQMLNEQISQKYSERELALNGTYTSAKRSREGPPPAASETATKRQRELLDSSSSDRDQKPMNISTTPPPIGGHRTRNWRPSAAKTRKRA
jgi:hypothetical protein